MITNAVVKSDHTGHYVYLEGKKYRVMTNVTPNLRVRGGQTTIDFGPAPSSTHTCTCGDVHTLPTPRLLAYSWEQAINARYILPVL